MFKEVFVEKRASRSRLSVSKPKAAKKSLQKRKSVGGSCLSVSSLTNDAVALSNPQQDGEKLQYQTNNSNASNLHPQHQHKHQQQQHMLLKMEHHQQIRKSAITSKSQTSSVYVVGWTNLAGERLEKRYENSKNRTTPSIIAIDQ